MMSRISVLAALLVVFGCSAKISEEEKLFDQSVEAHESALSLGKQVADNLVSIKEKLEKCPDQADAFEHSLTVLTKDLAEWESSLVEVPGYEHEHHDHGNDHNHDHHDNEPSVELTPKMVLDIQNELVKQAADLSTRSEVVLEAIACEVD